MCLLNCTVRYVVFIVLSTHKKQTNIWYFILKHTKTKLKPKNKQRMMEVGIPEYCSKLVGITRRTHETKTVTSDICNNSGLGPAPAFCYVATKNSEYELFSEQKKLESLYKTQVSKEFESDAQFDMIYDKGEKKIEENDDHNTVKNSKCEMETENVSSNNNIKSQGLGSGLSVRPYSVERVTSPLKARHGLSVRGIGPRNLITKNAVSGPPAHCMYCLFSQCVSIFFCFFGFFFFFLFFLKLNFCFKTKQNSPGRVARL